MDTLERLEPADVRAVVTTYRDALRAHQQALNRLNVYPVPDGDTGTNMALTLESVCAAMEGAEDMASTCKAISHGSLMGARGNSGVILCQVLRGLCDSWRGADTVDAGLLARALQSASEAAYRAVMRPVEGTILTVASAAARGAGEASAADKELVDVVHGARQAGAEALERTPELLAVLKEAGVVDAGGAGLLLLLDAMLHVVSGQPVPEPPEASEETAPRLRPGQQATSGHGDAGMDGPRFEVMYLLEAADAAIPALKRAWSDIGDSIVVVGGEGTWNCHIHTDDIGGAIEAALDVGGRPRRIHVTDLEGQVEEERWVREASSGAVSSAEAMTTAVVAVASGAGMARIFRSLGAAEVVAGGQSMNPSTAEILEAVEAAPARQVVVLPNNTNIVPVAHQVDGLTEKTVRVVPTRAVAEGMAALLEYDSSADAGSNAAAMAESAGRITSGEVTQAVRASSSAVGPIAQGSWLGISATGIEVVADTVFDAATALLAKLLTPDHELVTVLEGQEASPEDTQRIHEWLEHHCPEVDAEIHDGGQPLYPYLFSIE